MSAARRPLRAIVVDDSELAREAIGRVLADAGAAEVIGTAADGEEGLALALALRPELVLLDLQLPRMDGFTFLRLLMAQRPTPVIVVSTRASRVDVFKALELGALDFVAKPEPGEPVAEAREALLAKCAVVRALRVENLEPRIVSAAAAARRAHGEPAGVVVIGASTGGPQAVQRLLASLSAELPLAFLVAQHMPERFTRAFAERLARTTRFSVQEAQDGDVVAAGRVLVAPGGRHLELRRDPGGALRAAVSEPEPAPPGAPRYLPSIDRLFASAAAALGPRVCGVLLTGMGSDGAQGLAAVKAAGGVTLAESEETAVVYGMPQSAAARGAVDELLPLDLIAERLERFAGAR